MSENTVIRLQCIDKTLYATKIMLVTLSHYFEARLSDRWLESNKDNTPEIFLHFAAQDVMHVLQLYGNPKYVPQYEQSCDNKHSLAHKMQNLFVVAQFLTLKKDFKPVHWMYVETNKIQHLRVYLNCEFDHTQYFYKNLKLWHQPRASEQRKISGEYVQFDDREQRTMTQEFVTHEPFQVEHVDLIYRIWCKDRNSTEIVGTVLRCPKVYFE